MSWVKSWVDMCKGYARHTNSNEIAPMYRHLDTLTGKTVKEASINTEFGSAIIEFSDSSFVEFFVHPDDSGKPESSILYHLVGPLPDAARALSQQPNVPTWWWRRYRHGKSSGGETR